MSARRQELLQKLNIQFTKLRTRVVARGEELLSKLPPLTEILKKTSHFLTPLTILGGLLLALLCYDLTMAFLLKEGPSKPRPPRVIVEAPFVRAKATYDAINDRNLFCPGCPIPDLKMRIVEKPKDCNKAQKMTGSLKLIGTIVLSDPKYSVATLSDGASPEPLAVQIGDPVQSFGKVFEIRRNRLCVASDEGALSYLDIPEDEIRFGQPIPSAFNSSGSDIAKNASPGGIKQVTENELEIKRGFLMQQLNDPNILFQAYAEPVKENGEIKGFKIKSIVPGSIYESLNIQVGDTIVGANGEPMTSITRAQELFASARTASEVSIDVIRNGQNVTLKYKVSN